MKIVTFRDLRVWEKAHQLVIEVYKDTKSFPSEERYGLTSQVRRSAVSICANIVEGYTKSKKDFIRYLDISRGSLEETKYHLILCHDLSYFKKENYDKLFALTDDIGKMIYRLKQKLQF